MGDIFYWGRRGHGKTSGSMWEILFDWYSGNEIWTTTPLHPAFDTNYITGEKGNLHHIDVIDLVRLLLEDALPDNSKEKTLLMDEIMSQANARNFGSWINKKMVDFVSQARKRQFRVIYTAQVLGAYDKWLRLMTDKIIRCVGHGFQMCSCHAYADLGLGTKQYPEPIIFEQIEIPLTEDDLELTEPIPRYISRKTMRNIYPLYDTKKIITPVDMTDKYQELIQK